jgi:hypothetical protein
MPEDGSRLQDRTPSPIAGGSTCNDPQDYGFINGQGYQGLGNHVQ